MPRYRATVWILTSMVGAIEGDAGISRTIIEQEAESAQDFESTIRDQYLHDVDCEVSFGPISEKRSKRDILGV
jgi:hypothetical protein